MRPGSGATDRGTLAAVTAIVFVSFVGYGLLIPIVPLYARAFGADEFLVGLLLASYAFAQFLTAPIVGRLSDRYGRRRVLLVTIGGNVCAYVLLGLADSFRMLLLARVLSGVAGGNVAVAQAAVADAVPPDERARGFGLVGAAIGTGFVFGPALGGLFSSGAAVAIVREGLPLFEARITRFSLPSLVTAALAAANLLLARAFLPASTPAPKGSSRGNVAASARSAIGGARSSARRLLEDRTTLGLVVAYSTRTVAYTGMTSMFVVFTADAYGYDAALNGYVLAYVGVVVAVTQGVVVGPALARVGEPTAVGVGVSTQAACLVALPFAPALGDALALLAGPFGGGHPLLAPRSASLLLVMGALAAGDAFTTVGIKTLLSKSSPAERQGENLGFVESGDGLSRTVAPLGAGFLYETVGYWSPFVAGGAIVLLVLPVVVRLRRRGAFEDAVDRSRSVGSRTADGAE